MLNWKLGAAGGTMKLIFYLRSLVDEVSISPDKNTEIFQVYINTTAVTNLLYTSNSGQFEGLPG